MTVHFKFDQNWLSGYQDVGSKSGFLHGLSIPVLPYRHDLVFVYLPYVAQQAVKRKEKRLKLHRNRKKRNQQKVSKVYYYCCTTAGIASITTTLVSNWPAYWLGWIAKSELKGFILKASPDAISVTRQMVSKH